jgi:hypothetical protein
MEQTSRDADFRSHWLALPLELQLKDHEPDRPPVTIEVQTGDRPVVIEAVGGTVRVRPGTVSGPDAKLTGTPPLVLGVLTGELDLARARADGLEFEGDPRALRRVRP